MVVSLAYKIGGDRGRVASANQRRGITLAEYNERTLRNPLHMSVPMFERWLVQKFGKEYLQPVQLYKNGAGI